MYAGCVLLIALVHFVSAQGPPPNLPQKCRGPPQGVEKPHECCKIPAFFNDNDFAECGFEKLDHSNDASTKHRGPPDCTKQVCMLKKYNLLKDDESVDHEAVHLFMDKFVENNSQFKDAASVAKERCIGKPLPGPPQVCEPNKMIFCISSTLFAECPSWEPSEGCAILKNHMEECKPYFH